MREGVVKMSFDRFEEILKRKWFAGVHVFTRNRTHNVYTITNSGGHKMKWSLFINNKPVKTLTNFFAIADMIWGFEHQ